VPEDDAEAVKWHRLAAEQGNAKAQYNLGVSYDNGEGVPGDLVYAFAWFNLAAAQGHKGAAENKDIARKRMTPQQIAEAQTLSRQLAKKSPIRWQGKPAKRPTNASSRPLVRDIQIELNALGYTAGSPDGIAGRKTDAAIRAFQKSIGLPSTGKPSGELLMLLRAQKR
jgi:localization factor PodJL